MNLKKSLSLLFLLIFFHFIVPVSVKSVSAISVPICTHTGPGSCTSGCSPQCSSDRTRCSQCNCGLPAPGETCSEGGFLSQCNLSYWKGSSATFQTCCCLKTPTITCPKITGKACMPGGQVRIMWNEVPGVYSYRVYRNDRYRGEVTTNAYTDTGVKCGVQYSYDIKPYVSGGSERDCQQNVLMTCSYPTSTPIIKRLR